MIDKEERHNNITAICEVFLESRKEELKNVSEVIISLTLKNGSIENITTPKETFIQRMIEFFDSDLTNVSEIDIHYYYEGELRKLNGISII